LRSSIKLIVASASSPSGAPVETCCANNLNSELRSTPEVFVDTTSSVGAFSHSEPSMLRINADTRVLD
jgi:hypothetical protein